MNAKILQRISLGVSVATPVLLGAALVTGGLSTATLRALQDPLWYLSVGCACVGAGMAVVLAIGERRTSGRWNSTHLWPIFIGPGTLLLFGVWVAIQFGLAISRFDQLP